MRRIITIILLFITAVTSAQTASPIFQGSKYYEFRNAVRIDSAFFAPRRDTFITDISLKAEGMLTYRPQDKSLWYFNGSYWVHLSSQSGISSAIDSVRLSNDTLYFRYTTGNELSVKIAQSLQDITTPAGNNTTSNDIVVTNSQNIPSIPGLHMLFYGGANGLIYSGDVVAGTFSPLLVYSSSQSFNAQGDFAIQSSGKFKLNSTSSSSGIELNSQYPIIANQISSNPAVPSQRIKAADAIEDDDLTTKRQLDSLGLAATIDTTSLSSRINQKNNISDTSNMLSPYLRKTDTMSLSNRINNSIVLASNGLNKAGQLVKIGGVLTDSTNITTNNYNFRFLNNRPSFIEFKRTGNPATIKNSVVSVGMLGNPEANITFNMDYTDAVHRLYDTSYGAMWLALGSQIGAMQYAYATTDNTTDIWTQAGAPYAFWWTTSKGYAQFAVANNVSRTAFDANMMINRTVNKVSLSGYSDLVLAGHRTLGTAGDILLNPYDTGRVYLGFGGGKTFIGANGSSTPGDGTLTVSRSGTQPSITGNTVLIMEGNRLKGVAGDVYLNGYNTGRIYAASGGGAVTVGGILSGPEKLSIDGSVTTMNGLLYTNPLASGYYAWKDQNGQLMGAVGDVSTRDRDAYIENTIGTKLKFVMMPDTAAATTASSYIAMTIDSSRNIGIGDSLPQARLHVNGAVKFVLPTNNVKWAIPYRDSTTGNLSYLSSGAYGQILTAGAGGVPIWNTPTTQNYMPLRDFYADTSNTSTTPNTYTALYRYNIPGNFLTAVGQKISARYGGIYAVNANSKGLAMVVNGTQVGANSYTPSQPGWQVNVTLIRTGSNSVRVSYNADAYSADVDITGINFASGFQFDLWGAGGGAAGDVTAKQGTITWIAAAP